MFAPVKRCAPTVVCCCHGRELLPAWGLCPCCQPVNMPTHALYAPAAGTWQSGLDLADPLDVELPDDGLPTGLPDLDLPPADPLGQDHRERSGHFLRLPGIGDLTSPGALLTGTQVQAWPAR